MNSREMFARLLITRGADVNAVDEVRQYLYFD
jgi:hypothetical protein